jgi:hypothetical protein
MNFTPRPPADDRTPADDAVPGLSALRATDALLDRLGQRQPTADDLDDPFLASLALLAAEVDVDEVPAAVTWQAWRQRTGGSSVSDLWTTGAPTAPASPVPPLLLGLPVPPLLSRPPSPPYVDLTAFDVVLPSDEDVASGSGRDDVPDPDRDGEAGAAPSDRPGLRPGVGPSAAGTASDLDVEHIARPTVAWIRGRRRAPDLRVEDASEPDVVAHRFWRRALAPLTVEDSAAAVGVPAAGAPASRAGADGGVSQSFFSETGAGSGDLPSIALRLRLVPAAAVTAAALLLSMGAAAAVTGGESVNPASVVHYVLGHDESDLTPSPARSSEQESTTPRISRRPGETTRSSGGVPGLAVTGPQSGKPRTPGVARIATAPASAAAASQEPVPGPTDVPSSADQPTTDTGPVYRGGPIGPVVTPPSEPASTDAPITLPPAPTVAVSSPAPSDSVAGTSPAGGGAPAGGAGKGGGGGGRPAPAHPVSPGAAPPGGPRPSPDRPPPGAPPHGAPPDGGRPLADAQPG